MKLSMLVGMGIGYVLGTRAGRERYEQLVRIGRKVIGSQTVQATAGVLKAQVDDVRNKTLGIVNSRAGVPSPIVNINKAAGRS